MYRSHRAALSPLKPNPKARALARLVRAGICASFMALPARAQTATLPPGLILVAQVSGGNASQMAGAVEKPLQVNEKVELGAVVSTGKSVSVSVVLVFSNGATLQLSADTALRVDEFRQEPLVTAVRVADLVTEPTRSNVSLTVLRGVVTGKVPELRRDLGSHFTVRAGEKQVDVAASTFRVSLRPDSAAGAVPVIHVIKADRERARVDATAPAAARE